MMIGLVESIHQNQIEIQRTANRQARIGRARQPQSVQTNLSRNAQAALAGGRKPELKFGRTERDDVAIAKQRGLDGLVVDR